MKTLKTYHHLIYAIIFITDLIIGIFKLHQLEYFVKPAILTWIIIVFIQMTSAKSIFFRWGLLAFLCSLLGDVILLFSGYNEIFFLLGLSSFLLAHLFFILTFNKHKYIKPSFLKSHPIWIFIVVAAGITLFTGLFTHLDLVMKIAVFIYASAISAMVLMAINRKNQVNNISFIWVLAGAVLFFISDGILAINKFWVNIPFSSFWIMSTYMLAQYFILIGLVNQENKPSMN